jgi:hypothetical protein
MKKYPTHNKSGMLGQLSYTTVNELIGIDLFSGIPVTVSGYKVILVITDYLSKYTMAIPIKDKKAITVAEALLERWVTTFGFPKIIQSDQGKEFTAKISRHFFIQMKIKKMSTTPYTPKANGLVERFNKVLGNTLAKLACYDQLNWDKYISITVMEYNATVHATTGETPYFMMFGREFVFPTDIVNDTNVWDESPGYITPFKERIQRINEAKKRITESHRANADRYNKRQRPHGFQVGDKVIFLRELKTKKNISHRKLGLPGVGPFEITAVNDLGSRITIDQKGKLREVNAATLVKFYPRPEWMQSPAKLSTEELAGQADVEETEDEQMDDIEPTKDMSIPEIMKAFSGPPKKGDVIDIGAKVDAHIAKTWRHGTVARKDDSTNRAYVKGKNINRWINLDYLRPCACPMVVQTPVPKKKTLKRTTRIYARMH